MKSKFLITILALLMSTSVFSKNLPDTLLVNNSQQLVLQFPASIKYVDLGSEFIIGKMWNNQTCLSLCSRNSNIESTTISVVTSEGSYYSYVLKYCDKLLVLAYDINSGEIESKKIGVSSSKTTHFILDEDIVDIVVGNDSIIADNATGIKNIVKIRSLKKDIENASFTIIAKSGKIFPFDLYYEETPTQLSVYIGDNANRAMFSENPLDENKLERIANSVVEIPQKHNHLGVLDHRMMLSLDGIYSVSDWVVFHLHLENQNNIDYGIDFIKTYIRDKKNSKYSALQEQEIYPFYIYFSDESYKEMIPGKQKVEIVLFYNRFTIPQSRIMCFELFEKNGGRHLEFSISNKEILRAQRINNFK